MVAKSLDVVVLLQLILEAGEKTYAQLSKDLGISASEVHAAIRRCVEAGLIEPSSKTPLRKPVEEYLIYGVRYAFPAKRGPLSRGVPTAHAAPPLVDQISSEELPPVWPSPEGETKGYALDPLYRSVPKIAKSNPKLYELLALLDAIRSGRARERRLAEDELRKRLNHAITA
jgi:DNA-binding Lrp family transcriptional regulator